MTAFLDLLTRGTTAPLKKVPELDDILNTKPPKVRVPERTWTYYDRLPENSMYMNTQSSLMSLGLFDELAEQHAQMTQHRVNQVLHRSHGLDYQPARRLPDMTTMASQTERLPEVAAVRTTEQAAQTIARAEATERGMQTVLEDVAQLGQAPSPQFFGQGAPRRRATQLAVARASWTPQVARDTGVQTAASTRDTGTDAGTLPMETDYLGGAATQTPLATVALPEGPPLMYGPRRERMNPWSGQRNTARIDPLHGVIRDRALRANGFALTDWVSTTTVEEVNAPMVPHVLRQGPPPMALENAPVPLALQDGPQTFNLTDNEMGDADNEMQADDLERTRASRRRGDELPSEGRVRPRVEVTERGIVPFTGRTPPPRPMAPPAAQPRARESDSERELRRQRRQRDRELRRRRRRGMDPDAALDEMIRNTQADQQEDERRAAVRRIGRRHGGFPPAY